MILTIHFLFNLKQGWAGFAFPLLPRALQTFTLATNYTPATASGHIIDGNTAHSTGWWWGFGSGFYFGGDLYYDKGGSPFLGNDLILNQTGTLTYGPGRSVTLSRNPCYKLPPTCKNNAYCNVCSNSERRWLQLTNSKSFLIAGTGIVSQPFDLFELWFCLNWTLRSIFSCTFIFF
jgi:hypothetical protein